MATKLDIRKIWVIYSMLNGKRWVQNDLIVYLNNIEDSMLVNYIDEEKLSYKEGILPELIAKGYQGLDDELELTSEEAKNELGRPKKKISKPIISNVLKSLMDEKIIKKERLPQKGKGPDPDEYYLKDDFEALEKILDIFYGLKLDPHFSLYIRNEFISSTYAKKQIPTLLEIINKKMKFSFTEIEKESILNILFISPRAVSFALNYLKKFSLLRIPLTFRSEYKVDVEHFLLCLQLELGEDIKHLTLPQNIKNFEYKITVSFAGERLGEKNISKELGKDIIQTVISPKSSEEIYWNFPPNIDDSPL